ncbi:MAG: aspartyl protease family protein [Candidatus Methylomirabilales bacterium]
MSSENGVGTGTLRVMISLSHTTNADANTVVECLVDTGAAYSQFPKSLLASLGIAPTGERTIIYADGRRVNCQVGEARVSLNNRQTPTLVLFGEEGAPVLLGAMTLEGLALGVDPLGRQLVPVDVPMA